MSRYSIEVMFNTEQDTADVARISSDMVRLAEMDGGIVEGIQVYLWGDDGDDPVPVETPAGTVEEG